MAGIFAKLVIASMFGTLGIVIEVKGDIVVMGDIEVKGKGDIEVKGDIEDKGKGDIEVKGELMLMVFVIASMLFELTAFGRGPPFALFMHFSM